MRLLIPFAIGIASVAAAPNARVTARAVLPREGSNADIGGEYHHTYAYLCHIR